VYNDGAARYRTSRSARTRSRPTTRPPGGSNGGAAGGGSPTV
jgi:hypothetical protein